MRFIINNIKSLDQFNKNRFSFDIKQSCFDNSKSKSKPKYCDLNNLTKIFYSIKDSIHKILYDLNINIKFYSEKIDEYFFFFYLDLLLYDQPYFINYENDFEFITNINIKNKNQPNGYKKLFLSIIILDLIKNYKQTPSYDEYKDEKSLKDIKDENEEIIRNNIRILNNFNINLDLDKINEGIKIDEIYAEIIIYLIKNKDFNDISNICDIFSQLDLEYIDINKIIFEKLSKELTKDIIDQMGYKISKIIEIFDVKKLNFYYILLKYIIKDSYYLYYFPSLRNLQIKIKESIKSNLNDLNQNPEIINEVKKNGNLDKFEFIIKALLDDYNFEKFQKVFQSFIFTECSHHSIESKQNNNNCIEELIFHKKSANNNENCCLIEILKYMGRDKNLKESKNINFKYNYEYSENNNIITLKKKDINNGLKEELIFVANLILSKAIFLISNINGKICIEEINIGEGFINLHPDKFEKINVLYIFKFDISNYNDEKIKIIKSYKKLLYFLYNIIDKIKHINNKLKYRLVFKKENNDNEFFNISCKFIFYELKNNSEIVLNENNILGDENNSKIIDKIIDEINKYYIKDSEQEDNSNDYILNSDLFFLNFLIKDQTELENHFNIIFSIKSNYNFKELEKKNKFITKLNNEYYLGIGYYNLLYIYNRHWSEKFVIKNFEHTEMHICNILYNEEKNEAKLIIISKKKMYSVLLYLNESKYESKILKKEDISSYFNTRNNNSINNFIFYDNYQFNINELIKVIQDEVKNKNFVILIKSQNLKNNDKLIFLQEKEIIKNLKEDEEEQLIYLKEKILSKKSKIEYFISSSYGLAKVLNQNNEHEIIKYLFACKRYNDKKIKNGILLITPDIKDRQEMLEHFFDTGDNEIECICPISFIKKENLDKNRIFGKTGIKSYISENNISIDDNNTEVLYFLAGGFNKKKHSPIMQLYKLKFNEVNIEPIEFIQDIEYEKKENFTKSITSILQFENDGNNGNIIATNKAGGTQFFTIYIMNMKKN